MIPSSNPSGQHIDPSWVTDNWDHASTSSGAAYHQQEASGGGARPEWDWESQSMLLVHHPSGGGAAGSTPGGAAGVATAELIAGSDHHPPERKPSQLASLPTATLCGRPFAGANYSALHHRHHHHFSAIANFNAPPPALRSSYGADHQTAYPHRQALQQQQQPGGGFFSGFEYLNASPELKSYDQRRRFLGMMDSTGGGGGGGDPSKSVAATMLDFVKREADMYALEPHARIGLNLGGRTYFSAEDSASRLGKRSRLNALGGGGGGHAPMCQVQGCAADLSKAKHYHRRHKVCEIHSKAPNVIANAQTQRFCQQCSRFHPLSEFDDTKRSCRKRLADHNRRRRKPQHSATTAAVATISDAYNKTEEQSTNIRTLEGEHKPTTMLLHKASVSGNSPTASITERDSSIMSSGANRLPPQQSHTFGTIDEKLAAAAAAASRGSVLRSTQHHHQDQLQQHQNQHQLDHHRGSSDVQALVLSVVSRTATPTSAQSTLRHSPGTQESVYQHYLHGPTSLSLSSAGITTSGGAHQDHSPSSYASMEQHQHQHQHQQQQQQQCSVPWLGSARALQQARPAAFNSRDASCMDRSLTNASPSATQQRLFGRASYESEQLGRLGLQQSVQSSAGHQLLALIDNSPNPINSATTTNPAHQQQLTSSVDHELKPLLHHHSEMQSSGVRSSFGSSFYDSSTSIG